MDLSVWGIFRFVADGLLSMAISVTLLGTGNAKTTGVSPVVNNALTAGHRVIAVLAGDELISGSVEAVGAGASGGTLTLVKDAEANNASNVNISIWSAKVITTTGSGNIQCTGVDFVAKAMTVLSVSGLDDTPLDKTASATGNGTAASSGATATLTQADELVIGAIGVEDEIDDQTGVWDTGSGQVSGNEQETGTNGGGDASNISIYSAAQVVSATTAMTASNTGMDSIDWAAAIATYKGIVEPIAGQSYAFWF